MTQSSRRDGAQLPSSSQPSIDAAILFESDAQIARYEKLKHRRFRGTRCVDWDFYEKMGLKDSFRELLEECNLVFLSELQEDTYKHLTLEFLSSVKLEKGKGCIAFRLKGENYFITPEQIGSYFKVPYIGYPVSEDDYPKHEFWSELVGRREKYKWKSANVSKIKEPLNKMLHEFLTVSLNCRASNSNVVQNDDLFLMWCIKEGKKINGAYWLMNRFSKISKKDKGLIHIGGYVTHLAKCLYVNLNENDEVFRIPFSKNNYVGSRALEGLGVIEKFQGKWQPIQEEQYLPQIGRAHV